MKSVLSCLLLSLVVSGCAMGSKLKDTGKSGLEKGITYTPAEGYSEKQMFLSHSETKRFDSNELVHKKIEKVSFELHSVVKKKATDSPQYYVEFTTKNKNGEVDLHALAFPENDETLKYVFTENLDVVFADRFPKTSLFYLPPVFLPDEPMKVGDTWTDKREWQGLYNNLPLRIDVTSILQGIVQCPGGEDCANIEISGRVSITGPLTKMTQFNSLMQGRFLIGVDTAKIYWSEISSEEELITSEERVEIDSCIVSFLDEPKESALQRPSGPLKCDPFRREAKDLP